LGVPVLSSHSIAGIDSLMSIVQMPSGVPVGTLAVGEGGAFNAGILAAQILSLHDLDLTKRLENWRAARSAAVAESPKDDA
jgi:5-(carboxyamino)imidazole ribonucleotide mutase